MKRELYQKPAVSVISWIFQGLKMKLLSRQTLRSTTSGTAIGRTGQTEANDYEIKDFITYTASCRRVNGTACRSEACGRTDLLCLQSGQRRLSA